jgi:hypothetical protein
MHDLKIVYFYLKIIVIHSILEDYSIFRFQVCLINIYKLLYSLNTVWNNALLTFWIYFISSNLHWNCLLFLQTPPTLLQCPLGEKKWLSEGAFGTEFTRMFIIFV